MTRHAFTPLLLAMVLAATPALVAQNRQELQMQADLRQMQEQLNRLQLSTNQLAEQLKAVNGRVDQAAEANVKTFANQQLLINQISTTLSTVREKLDDNTVRVSQLTQEFTAVRDGLRMLTDQLNSLVSLLQPPTAPTAAADGNPAAAPAAGASAVGPVNLPSSPGTLYTRAMADYYSQRYDLAVEGFQELIKTFPDADIAARAQLQIGESLYQKKTCRDAIPEYQKVISNYRTSQEVPEAMMMLGVCNADLGRRTEAQRAYETLIKQYPQSAQAIQAQQRLDGMGVRR